jgi:hypothetical protein
VVGGAADDVVDAGAGDDVVAGGGGDDTLSGGAGNDRLSGDAGDDRLGGGDGNDHLLGGAGNDTLAGDAGDDRLEGDRGSDVLVGGAGRDRFTGGRGADTLPDANPAEDRRVRARPQAGGTGGTTPPAVTPDPVPVPAPAPAQPQAPTPARQSLPRPSRRPRSRSRRPTVPPDAPRPHPDDRGGADSTYGGLFDPAQAKNAAPKAVIRVAAGSLTAMAGNTINVHALNGQVFNGDPLTTKYEWDFGDAGTKYNKLVGWSAAHTYDKPGAYTLRLTVTDVGGKSSTRPRRSRSRRTLAGRSTSTPSRAMTPATGRPRPRRSGRSRGRPGWPATTRRSC